MIAVYDGKYYRWYEFVISLSHSRLDKVTDFPYSLSTFSTKAMPRKRTIEQPYQIASFDNQSTTRACSLKTKITLKTKILRELVDSLVMKCFIKLVRKNSNLCSNDIGLGYR